MSQRKKVVLDANILLRGVFGVRVRSLLEEYEDLVGFYAPDVCFEDARKYIPELALRRGFDATVGLAVLDGIEGIVEPVDRSLYEEWEQVARERITARDSEDWPIVATALLLDSPVWTEDKELLR